MKKDAWMDALTQALSDKRKLPEGTGWLTTDEVSKKWMKCSSHTRKMLMDMLKNKKVEYFSGRDTNENGSISNKVWWRLKK